MYKSEVQHTNPLFSVRRSMPAAALPQQKRQGSCKMQPSCLFRKRTQLPAILSLLDNSATKKESGSEEPPSHNSGDAIEKDASSDY